ncbi:MAG: phosphoribosylformylglycinamidine synthase subunit PurQ [Candidatus Bipolaricaulota bacterium]|nr:phosphoribosylformylglycinamidine synthase subunit PurQ [Candidatus Bipolaricaulota bacterium]MCS7274481.1 phosphoribosylformylglycinamidine synthase subunit PurQ [Candidatus Bipolaricaulota bacterium]MDW8111122.1 phosphoribosylformylglycinamidine synthase subunit PurQ [Candidatus Bipolaricaulota bacterium]
MRAAVVVFPGSNCDLDTHYVLKDLLRIETELLWYRETDLKDYDLIVLPGGFAYGDYLRAGAIARFAPVVQALVEYVERGRGLVLGICNGFQILTEAGLLPGALAPNLGRKFLCKTVKLRVENAYTPLTRLCREGELIELPIAHGEGRYVAPPETLAKLKSNRQILFTYHGENPNGSLESIAGIMDETGTVFGMMPHPERNCERLLGTGDGLKLLQGMVEEVLA